MSHSQAVAVYALEVPAGDVIVEAGSDIPNASFRITMAAIDPSAMPILPDGANGDVPVRATLKLLRQDPEDEDEDDYLEALLAGDASDLEDEDEDEESSDDEEINGGPSDPSKSRKARKEAAIAKLKKALEEDDEAMKDIEVSGTNGTSSKLNKGKGKAVVSTDESDSEEDGEDVEFEKFVLCTLDPEKTYQQTLDIIVNPTDQVFFQASGTHSIYLSGNYILGPRAHGGGMYDLEDEEDEEYDLSPDDDELDESDESDELDDMEDPRIMELGSDESEIEIPELITGKASLVNGSKESKKGKNKRAAEESDDESTLDQIIAKSLKSQDATVNGEKKLSKKQQKKLKNNAGQAVEAAHAPPSKDAPSTDSPASTKSDKKVQFAKNLEQGPTNSQKPIKSEPKPESSAEKKGDDGKPKPSLGVKTVQGVKVDDKKLGSGRVAKNGDRVSLRYIGKLENGKVFDANKKGKPFSFKIGIGEVIKGMDIGIVGMSVGGERRINIPSQLAYGSDAKPQIPANSNLCFDLKLLDISKR